MPTLYLIDGYAQFFRAYHAIRTPLTSPVTKEPTNMTFGFVGMLLKLLRGEGRIGGKPDYIAVTLDVSGDRGTFRSQLYPQYKANRSEPPSDLEVQVERCLSMLRDAGIPILGAEGFEADDVMATLVSRLRASHPDLTIRLISKDKDLKQLLRGEPGAPGSVELFDVHTDTPFGETDLRNELGLSPGQVIDMLTLMGDTVDNVPGVEGVGEKTAAALLKEWSTLENLLAHASEIKGKRGEKLREAAPRLPLSRELVTLRTDVPAELDLAAASTGRFNLGALLPQLKECGFHRYQDEVRALLGIGPSKQEPAAAAAGSADAAAPKPPPRAPKADPNQGGLFDAAPQQPPPARRAESGEYRCITTVKELAALVKELHAAPAVALDTETTGLSFLDAALCGVSICTAPGKAVYIPIRSPGPSGHLTQEQVLDALRPVLTDANKPKRGHNLKFDMLVLRNHGVMLGGLEAASSCDSMVASYLIDASRSSHGLDSLAMALLNRTNISITELIGTGKDQRTFDTVPLDAATQYAAEDADVAMQLAERMLPELERLGLSDLMRTVEMPLVEVLAEMEWNGVLVDADELDRQRRRLEKQIETILAELKAESMAALGRAFDPDSPKQLSAALFNKPEDDTPGLGIKPIKKTKTGFSTDAEVLEKLGEDDSLTTPIPRLILGYRRLSKLVSTYLVALKEAIHPRTGRIHASFHQTVAATGRLASSDPNLQNIPIRTDDGREIRRAFIAPPGRTLITADYSQIELRLLAHLSKDPALIEAFHQGADIHTAVAAQIHGIEPERVTREQRSGAKMVNFGIVYGITSYGLARRLKIDERAAAVIIDGYKKRFAGITTFLQECVEQARSGGFVTTILGRRRPIPDVDSNVPARRALAERLAINSVVQGSAADLIKLAMVNIHRDLKAATDPALRETRLLLQIHDELVFEAPDDGAETVTAFVKERMQGALRLSVPLLVDAHHGKTWFEGK